MKFFAAMSNKGRAGSPLPADHSHDDGAHGVTRPTAAFTMIEIALCLAIIGFALVAIIGVLPYGLGTQRDNRQETLVGQDASLLVELIRNGSHGADDLVNYVIAITNYWTFYNGDGSVNQAGKNTYTYTTAFVYGVQKDYYSLTNGSRIIGQLSTPEFYTNAPSGWRPLPDVYHGGYSNHVVAYVRSISGLVAEKPPQDNSIMREDAFTYRLYVVNAPFAQDSNYFNLPPDQQGYARHLDASLHELRLTFLWPQRANGTLGNGRLTFRASIGGDLKPDNNGLFFYQPQSFTTPPP